MMRLSLTILVAAALLSLQVAVLPISARAGDLSAPDALHINTDEAWPPNNAAATHSPEDDASRLSDLKSSLARRNGPPALSLSVSGWVGEQVIHTVNH